MAMWEVKISFANICVPIWSSPVVLDAKSCVSTDWNVRFYWDALWGTGNFQYLRTNLPFHCGVRSKILRLYISTTIKLLDFARGAAKGIAAVSFCSRWVAEVGSRLPTTKDLAESPVWVALGFRCGGSRSTETSKLPKFAQIIVILLI